MKKTRKKKYVQWGCCLLGCTAAIGISSCVAIDDPVQARAEHVKSFNAMLKEREKEVQKRILSLDDCIYMAMKQNYDVLQADIKRELSKLDKSTSFASFLPNITASANLKTWSIPQSANGASIADKTYRSANLDGTLPLLVPSAYFLYQNSLLGADIAAISSHYVRQCVVVQTTNAYYQVLITEYIIDMLKTQVKAAQALNERISGLSGEGLVSDWERKQADYLLLSRKASLESYLRKHESDTGELLRLIGLSPLTPVTLLQDIPTKALPEAPVEELVFKALQQHPSLSIADHQVVMGENSIRAAIANFLPDVYGFANSSWTSDSFAKHVSSLYGGFSASMSLFEGLTKINRYKSSKLTKQSLEYDREALFLTIMLEVVKARNAVIDSVENLKVAESAKTYLEAKVNDLEAKQQEGLIPINELLDTQAEAHEAASRFILALLQKHLSLVQLDMAMGNIEAPDSVNPLTVPVPVITPENQSAGADSTSQEAEETTSADDKPAQ